MRIRKARLSDAPVIAAFNRHMARETEKLQLTPARVLRGVRALLRDPAKGTYFVTEAGGEIIGQLLITYEWSDWRNGNFWWVQSVCVHPDHRGRGVFQAIFGHVAQLAKRRKDVCGIRLYVDAHNARARRTYEKLGFKLTNYELFEMDFVLSHK
jgi:GNAT superfamily N-acetyltransferase